MAAVAAVLALSISGCSQSAPPAETATSTPEPTSTLPATMRPVQVCGMLMGEDGYDLEDSPAARAGDAINSGAMLTAEKLLVDFEHLERITEGDLRIAMTGYANALRTVANGQTPDGFMVAGTLFGDMMGACIDVYAEAYP